MRKLLCPLAVYIMALLPAGAATYTVNSGQSQSAIQGVINGTSAGDTVVFSAGSYPITSTYTLKCGVTYTGPVANPATAQITTSTANIRILTLSGACTSGITIEYLHLNGAGPFYADQSNHSNITFEYNQVGGIPAEESCGQTCESFFLDGTLSTSVQNVTIEYNTFGDINTCTAGVNVDDGSCAGILVAPTHVVNFITKYNTFYHLLEGIHFYNVNYSVPNPTANCDNCDIEFNFFNAIHRIALEFQTNIVGHMAVLSNNVYGNPLNGYYGTLTQSIPCCQYGSNFGTYTTVVPADVSQNNVEYNSTALATASPIGIEMAGNGTITSNNLIQGYFCQGVVYSFKGPSSVPWYVQYNTLSSAQMALGGASCGNPSHSYTGYIIPESGSTDTPVQTGNITNTTPAAVTSVAPGISPAPGGYGSPLTVTLTDPGYTSGPQPLGNTSIYYTTDGSTPNPSGASTAAQYYLSPSGNDANAGTLASPWLTPSHAVNCGDTITAVAGTYSPANFNTGKWGNVTCSGGNNVAWVKCATFDGCKINSTTGTAPGLWIDKSYWGVQGFEVSVGTGATFGTCFEAGVPSAGTVIHHIVFANNIANGCQNGGFVTFNQGTTGGVDYVAFIGNIAYNAAQGSHSCTSGFSIYQPIASDTNVGTHFYIAGNFAWHNVDPATCNGTPSTDGEPVIIDTLDFSQGSGTPYTQQVAVENNIGFFNGGRGFEVFNNRVGGTSAQVYVNHNTAYGDMTDNNQTNGCLGRAELAIVYSKNTHYDHNLAQTRTGTSCSGGALLGLSVETGDSSDTATNNWYYSAVGNNTLIDNSSGFSLGSGNVNSNPNFTNPVDPGAPSCGSFSSVPACMAAVVADYTPKASGAAAYGYQAPVSTPVTNALFPTWLCNVGLPPGLVSTPCVAGNSTKLYTVPIIVSLPSTIKAVGMWGAQNQPTSYPSGFGFTPSAVQTANYVPTGGVTLSSVSIAPTAGQTSLLIGGSVQMIVTCHYSDSSTQGCNTTDSYGNSVTSWASSTGNVTVSSSGLASGASIGTAVITAIVTGGFSTSPGSTLTVSSGALTLSSLSLATSGSVTSMPVGATNQLLATCHYSDGSTTSCATMDSHGNALSSAASSAPSVASTTSPGALVTAVAAGTANLSASVTPAPSQLGTSLQNLTGYTNNGYINEIYGVTGTSAGSYTVGNCHIILPATAWVAGKLWTCLLVLGTPTMQNGSAVCSNSYTTTGTSWPGGDLIIPMVSCPALPPDQGYWVGSTTNQTTANPAQGFSNCNSSCSGAPPIFGSGTYAYRYVANTFGNYTSLPTTLTASGGTQQVSQYIELTTTPVTSANLPLSITMPPPSLVSAYLTASSGSMIVGDTMQMAAKCHYTSGPDQDCTVADIYGDAVAAWVSSDPTKATVNTVGAATPGLVTAVAAGTPSIAATIGSGTTSSPYPITISNPLVTLTGVSLSLTGGVTGLFVGATNQLKATCTYSDGSNDDCTTTDVHGTLAHNYNSTSPAHATVDATSGLVTGVSPGATTFTALAGSFTSNALPLNVFPVLSGIYTITVSGSVKFSGTVRF